MSPEKEVSNRKRKLYVQKFIQNVEKKKIFAFSFE